MANAAGGIVDRAKAGVARLRRARPALDHLIRAYSRYTADTGDRLAAAVTYFGFLSFFPLVALAFSVLGFVVHNDPALQARVASNISGYLPGLVGDRPGQLNLQTIANARAGAGIAGLVGLLLAGLGWVDALREAIRSVWHQKVSTGNFITRKLIDTGILAGLGLTLVVSLAVSGLATAASRLLLDAVGIEKTLGARLFTSGLGIALGLLADTALFLYLFVGLPRLQTPWRRVLRGALFAAVGFEVIKLVGAFYIKRTTANPLYGTFAVVIGLLLWINLVSRFLLFCAAWTVTAPYDTDVAPSGTASREQARKAGVPEEYADSDPDDPPALRKDGAPTPLVPTLQGRTPPQHEPEGPPPEPGEDPPESRGETHTAAPVIGATAGEPAGAQATRTAARIGLGAMALTAAAVAAYALRSIRALLRS
ncbi:MAG: hypothetical protein NVSMB13_10750 [Mycobacteriales bacterium]